jgi:hypothetical protein
MMIRTENFRIIMDLIFLRILIDNIFFFTPHKITL